MPVGVPAVPFAIEGEEELVQWVDLFTRLYRERILFLCQELDEELGNQLIGIMIYINGVDEEEEQKRARAGKEHKKPQQVFLYINSPGGSVICGIGVYDAINHIKPDVTTISIGSAASMASFVLTGGTLGKRIALPNTRIMIHQPEGGSQGQTSEVVSESDEVIRIRRQVGLLYAERTGQTLNTISRDMDRDQFMSAKQAKEYGLVDRVVVHYSELMQ